MAVQWGSYETDSNGLGVRVGLQVEATSSVSHTSTTFTVTFSCWTQNTATYADNQTLNISSNVSLSSSQIDFFNGQGTSATKRGGNITATYTYPGSSYGTSPGNVTITVTLSGAFNGVTPSKTINVAIPARPWANPSPPTNANATRISDTQANLTWTNNSTTPAPYQNIKVYRSVDGGPYALRTTLGVVTSYSDTGLSPNHKYRWRINALGRNGTEVTGDETGDIWTTPAAPSNCAATKLAGGNIRITWTNNVAYPEYQTEIEHSTDGGQSWSLLATVSAGTTSHDHVAPGAGTTHTYRVRARTTAAPSTLFSGYSAPSNTITLLSTANPPSGLVPSGAARDATENITLSWVHNPTDGTPQTSYRIKYSVNGGAEQIIGPIASSAQSHIIPADTWANGSTITWRVATAGENGVLSSDSATATFTTRARPTVTITSPTDPYNSSSLTVQWAYFQEQGSPQTSYVVELRDVGQLVDTFTRTVSEEFGQADTGQQWQIGAAPGTTFSVTGTVGRISLDGVTTIHIGQSVGDVVVKADFIAPTLAQGNNINCGVVLRHIDINNLYEVRLRYKPNGFIEPVIIRRANAQDIVLDTAPDFMEHVPGQTVFVRAEAVGQIIRGRVWTGAVEPDDWHVEATDATHSAGSVGIKAFRSAGNTNTLPVVLDIDYFEAVSPAVLLEAKSGGAQTEATLATALEGDANYLVTVIVTSADGLESIPAAQSFTVQFLPPADVNLQAEFDRDSGAMVLTLVGDDPVDGQTVDVSTVDVQRRINSGDWETIISQLALNGSPPTAVVVDTTPVTVGTNVYRVIAYSDLPSSAIMQEVEAVTDERKWSYLSAGDGFATVTRLRAMPQFQSEPSRSRALYHFAGRPKPVVVTGEAETFRLSVAANLTNGSSTVEEFEEIARIPGIALWRDVTGRRIFVMLSRISVERSKETTASIRLDMIEVDDA